MTTTSGQKPCASICLLTGGQATRSDTVPIQQTSISAKQQLLPEGCCVFCEPMTLGMILCTYYGIL